MSEELRYERIGAASVLTIDRPERRNAMNVDLLGGLYDALDALRLDPLDDDELTALVRAPGLTGGDPRSLLAGRADGYFRAELLPREGEVGPGFAVVLVLDGSGEVRTERGGSLAVERGAALVVPWSAGRWDAPGVELVACRPPLPALAAAAP